MPEEQGEGSGADYKTEVKNYSNEELLSKERSKRRRKTGDVVGTGLTAAAAISQPALWAIAGANAKSYMSNSSKHKVILKEMSRRGLKPVKEDISDTVLPILTSAGSMAVGRAFGGKAGLGVASMAGDIIHSVGNRALGGSSSENKKEKSKKPGRQNTEAISYAREQPNVLQTPSAYQLAPNQAPPQTIVFNYVPPSAEYPRGHYAPASVQPAAQPAAQPAPQPVYQAPQPAVIMQQSPQQYQPQYQPQYQQSYQPQYQQQNTPAMAYQYAPSEPQYYQGPPPQMIEQQPYPGVARSQTFYDAPPSYQPRVQRAQTIAYR